MIANPQATTHEPTRCPVKFNRPKYAGRVCLIEVTRFPAEARRGSGIPGTPSFRRSLIAHSGRMGARRGFLRGRRRSFPLLFQNETPPDGRIASRRRAVARRGQEKAPPSAHPLGFTRPNSPPWPARRPRRTPAREGLNRPLTPPPRISQWHRGTLHHSAQACAIPRR